MPTFTFVTTNSYKFKAAQVVCKDFDVEIDQAPLDFVEIQADDGNSIASNKAIQAFNKYKKPIVITDDTWMIHGLGGFPGPYMKQVNGWFRPEDFLRLTLPLSDRRITKQQILVYKDERVEKHFSINVEGVLLKEVRGSSEFAHFCITSFDGGKHSVAELDASGVPSITQRHSAWHELCSWLTAERA